MSNRPDINDQREMNKISLETFHFNKENYFEGVADSLITSLLDQNKELDIAYKNIEKSNDDIDQLNVITEIYYNNEQLLALEGMKVIYAFKHLEINMKILIRATYSVIDSREFYRWDKIISFLKTKNIDASKLDGYKVTDELRKVNNAFKHSNEPGPEVNKITEFKAKTTFQYTDLQSFYNRIKSAPGIFLESLAWAIYKDLYEFNDQKIDSMAYELVLRMGKTEAKTLIRQLLSKYDLQDQ